MRAAVTSKMTSAQPPRSTSLNFRVARELLKHKDSYNYSIRPFLQGLSSHTHGVLRYLPPHLLNLARDAQTKKFLPLEQVLRRNLTKSAAIAVTSATMRSSSSPVPGNPGIQAHFNTAEAINMAQQVVASPDPHVALGMEALNTLALLEDRLAMTEHQSLLDVPYEFNVGDLVVHKDLRQLGVVAARLPVCLESESWVVENIGSMTDRRMAHPWYLILVAHHAGLPLDFVRYGSQLTHIKMTDTACKPIGFHRLLPLYFQGYDMDRGCYIQRGKPPAPSAAQIEEDAECTEDNLLRAAIEEAASAVKDAEVVAIHQFNCENQASKHPKSTPGSPADPSTVTAF